MNKKSHAERVMNKKEAGWEIRRMLGWQQEGLIPNPK